MTAPTVLAEGWSSTVYRIGSKRVLKVLREPKNIVDLFDDGATIAQAFGNETAALTALDGLRVPRLHSSTSLKGRPAIELECLPGHGLQELLELRTAFDISEAARVVVSVLRIVDAIHARGWAHGDLNPRNILVDGDTVALVDLGATFRLAEPYPYIRPLGRHRFMAAEHLAAPEGRGLLGRGIDVHQCGSLLVTLIAGREPLRAPLTSETYWTSYLRALQRMANVASRTRINAATRHKPLPTALLELLEQALHPNPALRYASAAAMADDLEGFAA